MPTVNNRLSSIFTSKPVNDKPVHSLNIPAEISLKAVANINHYGRPAISAGWAGKFVKKTVRATANCIAYCHSTVKEWVTCFGEKLISRQCRSLTQTEQLIAKFRHFDRLDDDDLETVSTQENEERYKQCAMLSQFILGCERQESLCQSKPSHSASTISLKGLFCLSLLALSGLCGATGNPGIQDNNQYLFKLSYVPYGRNKSKSKDLLFKSTMSDNNVWNMKNLHLRKAPSKFNVQVLNYTTSVPLELVKCIKGESEPNLVHWRNENVLSIENNSCNYIATEYSSTPQEAILKIISTSDGENRTEQHIHLWLEFYLAIRMHEISSLISMIFLLLHLLNKNKKRAALETSFHVNNIKVNAKECHLRLQIFQAIWESRKTSKSSIKSRIDTIARKILDQKQNVNSVTKNFVIEMLTNPAEFNIKDTDILNASENYLQLENVSSNVSSDDVSQTKLLQYYRTVLNYLFNQLTLTLNSAPVTINFKQLNLTMTQYANIWGNAQASSDRNVKVGGSRDLAEKNFIITPIMKRLPKKYLNNSKLFSATQNLRPTYGALNYDYARRGAAPMSFYGVNFVKLNNSIKNRVAYCLSANNLEMKINGTIPLPTTDIKCLVLDLMNSCLSDHEKLLKSVIDSILFPKRHSKAVHKYNLQSAEYIECMIFENINMRNHFSELHYFTGDQSSPLPDEEIKRLSILKHQGKIPCELYIDEHKIPDLPIAPIVPFAHLLDGKVSTQRLLEKLITRGKFKRLSPHDSEIRRLGQDDVCPISQDSLQTIPRIISYNAGGRICRISESAILSSIAMQGTFRCPFTGEVLITDFGPGPAATMTVQIVAAENSFSRNRYYMISYDIYPGFQTQRHRNPGMRYPGNKRVAYLPKTDVGAKLCYMLREAFAKRLIFTVGLSLTRGVDNVVVWNDIHHKTSINTGAFALCSDPGYPARLRGELEKKGIQYPEQTPDDSELTTFLDNHFEEHLTMKRTEQARTLSETTRFSS